MDQRCWQDQNLWVVRGRLSIRKSCSLSVQPACLLTSHNTCIHRDVCAVTPLKMKLSKHAEPFLLGIPSNSATAYDSFAQSCFPSTCIKQLTAIWRLQTKVGKDEACLLEGWVSIHSHELLQISWKRILEFEYSLIKEFKIWSYFPSLALSLLSNLLAGFQTKYNASCKYRVHL